MSDLHLTLRFHGGTLVLDPNDRALAAELDVPACCRFDERVNRWRAPADAYFELFAWLHLESKKGRFSVEDEARAYEEVPLRFRGRRIPRDYQLEAVKHWVKNKKRGLVVLPTGAGKSFVAHLAMAQVERSTLIVVPTIDLMNQWYDGLLATFEVDEVGMLGGGSHDLKPLTVTTYDSAAIHMGRYGDRFGLLIFDEAHHLPGPTYLQAPASCIAPFRLGLTATPERPDNRHQLLDEAIGPIVYRREIKELAGDFLSDYDVQSVTVTLTEEEFEQYTAARATYLEFIRSQGIRFDRAGGWSEFIMRAAQSRKGRRAMKAYRRQREIALTCRKKRELVERLLTQHAQDRTIVFTNDNATVYELSRRLLLPTITHQTPAAERREVLARFNDGTYPALVTSKVLNEGVDVPAANVAIVLSGSGSVREHVQRLGRILRKQEGKRALLYEVITENTVETYVSERRREHDAYR